MTQLEAFEQAQKTGQIAISKNTAKAFAALVKLNDVFYYEMMEAITENYCKTDYDKITEPYTSIFTDLHNGLLGAIMHNCIYENGLSNLEFNGL